MKPATCFLGWIHFRNSHNSNIPKRSSENIFWTFRLFSRKLTWSQKNGGFVQIRFLFMLFFFQVPFAVRFRGDFYWNFSTALLKLWFRQDPKAYVFFGVEWTSHYFVQAAWVSSGDLWVLDIDMSKKYRIWVKRGRTISICKNHILNLRWTCRVVALLVYFQEALFKNEQSGIRIVRAWLSTSFTIGFLPCWGEWMGREKQRMILGPWWQWNGYMVLCILGSFVEVGFGHRDESNDITWCVNCWEP